MVNKRWPSHWRRKKLQDVTTYISRGKSPKYAEKSRIAVINQKCIYWDGFHEENVKYLDESVALTYTEDKFINPGDVLLNSTGTGTIGRAIVFRGGTAEKYVADSHVTVIRIDSENLLAEYLVYWLSTSEGQRKLETECFSGSTNQIELNKSKLAEFEVVLPPLPEQRKIAAILTSVDNTIAATQRIIDQTERVKRGLMQQLLTRGIGHTKFKKTEIGEIPVEWEVVRLRDIGTWYGGGTPAKDTAENWTKSKEGIIWVSPKDMTSDIIVDSEDRITSRGLKDKGLRLFPVGTILIVTRSGILRNRVPIAMAGKTLTINQDLKALEVSPDLNAEYLFFTLKALEDKIRNTCVKSGTTVESIDVPTLKEFQIPLPPRYEQDKIAEIIRSLYLRSSKETQYLNILNHLKRGLMHLLLTGKVRVKVDEEAEAVV